MNDRTGIIYKEIAEKVIDLFERNGFTTEYPVSPVGLQLEITNILRETIEGNVNYSVATDPNEESKIIQEALNVLLDKVMHPLLDKYLCDKYPKIFADRHKPMTETCMYWGFDCGNGWHSLIDNLCSQIQHHIDTPHWVYNEKTKEYEEPPKGATACSQVVADQVKEKFSGLHFYVHGGDEYTHALIDQAEDLSYFICEMCGRMDETVGRNHKGWIQTTCKEHSKGKEDFTPNGKPELAEIWKKVREDEEKDRQKQEEQKNRGNLSTYEAVFGKKPEV